MNIKKNCSNFHNHKYVLFSHNHCDFDGFASMIALSKFYQFVHPQNTKIYCIINSTFEPNLKNFIDTFQLFNYQIFDESLTTELDNADIVLVDSVDISFIKKFKLNPKSISVYDHHDTTKLYNPNLKYYHKKTGSCISFILDEIFEKYPKMEISYEEALLFILGIYEDTGNLKYFNTTKIDKKIAKFLIEKYKIEKNDIDKFLHVKLTNSQNSFYDEMLKNRQIYILKDNVQLEFILIELQVNPGSFGPVINKYQKQALADIMFFIIKRKNKTYVMARSKNSKFEVLKSMKILGGGGGHKMAAACAIFREDLKTTFSHLKDIVFNEYSVKFPKYKSKKIQIIKEILKIASENNIKIFAVGGIVRDFVMHGLDKLKNIKNLDLDLDLTNDTDAIFLGNKILENCKAFNKLGFELNIRFNKQFNTINLKFVNTKTNEKFDVDIATLRDEVYKYSGALPSVLKGDLYKDLKRRDFTINALAMSLNNENFGAIYDYYYGLKDIRNKILRVLHNNSFVDDPTRIFRLIRFAVRFDFKIEANTQKLLKKAKKEELYNNISKDRLLNEFKKIFSEKFKYIKKILQRLDEFGFLEIFFDEKIEYSKLKKCNDWIEYIAYLIGDFEDTKKNHFIQKFNFSKKEKKVLLDYENK